MKLYYLEQYHIHIYIYMLFFKSRHTGGLDYFIFNTIHHKTHILKKKNYYLYTLIIVIQTVL